MNRILTWNALDFTGNLLSIGATYYIDADYEPVAVRIYCEQAPDYEDAEFNIYDDGETIFADRSSPTIEATSGGHQSFDASTTDASTNLTLAEGENESVDAEDFKEGLLIEEGSWVSCNLIKDGGGKNFSVHLELRQISESDESED